MKGRRSLAQLAGSGDDGTTGLLGGERVPKDDARVEAFGTVDEASSAIGLGRALCRDAFVRAALEEVQRVLYRLGSQLAATGKGEGRFQGVEAQDADRLDSLLAEIEARAPMPSEFILPGQSPGSAALDLARAVVRRAERRLVALERKQPMDRGLARRYLNRLSLVLFALGRLEEETLGETAKVAKDRA